MMLSFRDAPQAQTRNPEVNYLELPGSMLRIAPE
jgi:hypothetical protein